MDTHGYYMDLIRSKWPKKVSLFQQASYAAAPLLQLHTVTVYRTSVRGGCLDGCHYASTRVFPRYCKP